MGQLTTMSTVLVAKPLPVMVSSVPPPRDPLKGDRSEITGSRANRRSASLAIAISALPRLPTRSVNSSSSATGGGPSSLTVNDSWLSELEETTPTATLAYVICATDKQTGIG